ncbi:MAG: hypothetical protein ACYCWN_12110 [Ferrimicrobium sp.]|uniref:hypothetical protein n=1 Tax=Ferrimicrobium sp. TaxID=2926050 RepID=UPI00263109AD|nr:hypothetical protein [Ferrimicrobium sp.]
MGGRRSIIDGGVSAAHLASAPRLGDLVHLVKGVKRVIRRLFVLGCATLYTGGGGQWTPSQI